MKLTPRALLVLAIILLTGLILVGFTPDQSATAQTDAVTAGTFRGTLPVANFDVSPPLRDMAPGELKFLEGIEIIDDFETGLEGPLGPQDQDPLVQSAVGTGEIPDPIVSFNGPANLSGVQPPDPNGDVGPNHVVVMSNLSFQIFDKAGNSLYGPALNNTLWSGFGGACQNENAGDPIVLHDQIHDRWILSQFTANGPTYYNCVAISTSPDPTGTYYRYAFTTGSNFPDYPKYGVWSNAYYISTREFGTVNFAGVGAYAIEIADVISGNPTPTVISFLVPPGSTAYNVGDGLLPADIDGATLPPSNVAYFMGSMDNGGPYGAPQDALTLWKFTPDFTTPANSTFVLANTIPITAFDTMFSGCSGRSCIPQPGTTAKVDILSYRQRPIWRLAYRNFGSHEVLVTNQSVEATGIIAGNRWWEIRDPGGAPFIYQEGTYAPGTSDGIHRWMGSIAMDGSGNIAFSYSASNGTTTFPSVWYTGRLAGDPLGQMTLGEGSIIDGTGSQTSGERWGDYSSLTVDPVDDCTFWAVNEWLPATGGNWTLRIGAFKFDECGSPDFTLSVTPDSQAVCTPDEAVFNVNVGQVQSYTDPVTLSAEGHPSGTTTDFSINPVTPPGSSILTIGNTGAATAGNYSIDVVGVAATSTHTATVSLDVYTAIPGAPALTFPANGAQNVPTQPAFTWNSVASTASYFIEIATDPNFTNVVDNAAVTTNSYTPAAALNPSTLYFWRVTASNPCGPGDVSATRYFTTLAAPGYCAAGQTPNLLLEEGFESGATPPGWSHSGTGNTWAASTVRVHEGTYAFHATDPATVSAQYLYTPQIVLPSDEFPLALQFWNHQTIEDLSATACFDGALIDISTDGGTTWTQLDAELLTDPYNGPISTGYSNPRGGDNAWCGDPQDWLNSVVDLNAFAGQTIQLRFGMTSDSSVNREGWYVDQVLVQSCLAAPGTLEGTVTDGFTGTPLAGAQIAVSDVPTTTVTNASGYYSLTLPGGIYTLTVAATDYMTETLPSVFVSSGVTTTQDVSLYTFADLSLTKTAPFTATVGDTFTYTLEVVNLGPATAYTTTLTDALPAGVTFVSAVGCTETGGVVTCALGDLSIGVTATVEIAVTASAAGTLTNTAEVLSLAPDPTLSDNTASATTEVSPLPPTDADLSLTKTAPVTATVGDTFTYTLTVVNLGPATAYTTTLTDTLPAGVTFVSAVGCTETGGVVTCELGHLTSGATATVEIVVTVDLAGSLTNTAEVQSASPDPDSTNNTASATTEVSGPFFYEIFLPITFKH
jgi:uncharacterized repeat protein (TIGR01451 family)